MTFTRFLAAFAVVIFHKGTGVFPFHSEPLHTLFDHAFVAVSYFFVLSGFVLVLAYYPKNEIQPLPKKRFWLKRIARIYPVYVLALLIWMIAPGNGVGFNFLDLFLNAFLLQSWVPGHALSGNFPGWSLSVEAFFYLLFPFLLHWFLKMPEKRMILIALGGWVMSQLLTHYLNYAHYAGFGTISHELIYYFPPMHLNAFIVGMVGGILFKRKKIQFPPTNAAFIALGSLVAIAIVLYFRHPNIIHQTGLLAPLFLLLMLSLADPTMKLISIFAHKIPEFLGKMSYSMYILQTPIWLWTDWFIYQHLEVNYNLKFWGYAGILMIISGVVYYYFEQPIRNRVIRK